jgi:hypothetical protein
MPVILANKLQYKPNNISIVFDHNRLLETIASRAPGQARNVLKPAVKCSPLL